MEAEVGAPLHVRRLVRGLVSLSSRRLFPDSGGRAASNGRQASRGYMVERGAGPVEPMRALPRGGLVVRTSAYRRLSIAGGIGVTAADGGKVAAGSVVEAAANRRIGANAGVVPLSTRNRSCPESGPSIPSPVICDQ